MKTDQCDARVIHAKNFLATHFQNTLGINFFHGTYGLRPSEVFDEKLALTPILRAAHEASLAIYNRSLVVYEEEDASSATGIVARMRSDVSSTDLFMLVAAAEDFFSISHYPNDIRIDIDILPLIASLRAEYE